MHYSPTAFDTAQPLAAPRCPLTVSIATVRDAWKSGLDLAPITPAGAASGLDLIKTLGANSATRAAALAWRLQERGVRRVAILGLITQGGSWGPVFEVISALKDAGIEVAAYEAALPSHRAPDLLRDSLAETIEDADAVILTRREPAFFRAIGMMHDASNAVVDLTKGNAEIL